MGFDENGNPLDPNENSQVIDGGSSVENLNVTADSSEEVGGLNGGIIAVIIVIMLLVICAGLWIALNIVAKKCPDSKIGKKFNDWKAKRALNNE